MDPEDREVAEINGCNNFNNDYLFKIAFTTNLKPLFHVSGPNKEHNKGAIRNFESRVQLLKDHYYAGYHLHQKIEDRTPTPKFDEALQRVNISW